MADEDYWEETKYVGYSFNENDNFEKESDTIFGSKLQNQSSKTSNTVDSTSVAPVRQASSNYAVDYGLYGNILKLNLKDTDDLQVQTPENTIHKMVFGLGYSLEHHKSLNEKITLLDLAIKSHDGNVIIAIVLFLKNTLKKSLFQREVLQKYPEAMNHYLHFLEENEEFDELLDTLFMTENAEDAAIIRYRSALKTGDIQTRIKKLKSCCTSHFQLPFVSPAFAESLSNHIVLLERQLIIDGYDLQQETNEIFQVVPKRQPLVDTSAIRTLFHCCLYHYNLGDSSFASPSAIKKLFRLTDKQFVWVAVSALSQLQNWREIDNLFLNKSWLGNVKMNCCIGFNKVVPILAAAGAPPKVMVKYIELVEDIDERLSLAKQYKYHEAVMKILTAIRDKQEFLVYKSMFSPQSIEYVEVEEVLRSPTMKWKN